MLSSLKKKPKCPLKSNIPSNNISHSTEKALQPWHLHPRDCCQSAVWCHYRITVYSTLSMPVMSFEKVSSAGWTFQFTPKGRRTKLSKLHSTYFLKKSIETR